MSGNEVGDRVHNFFAQDNLSQSRNNPQVVDGNWPALNNNLWVGSQRQIAVPSSYSKNYNPHQSDLERGNNSHPLHVPHGLHFTQSTLRPEFANNQSQNQQPNLNGYMYGRQVLQRKQDEANFLGVDTESDQQHKLNPRGLSIYESPQGNGPEHHAKSSVRSEASESPVSFDFFGGQQQMTGQHPSMLQSLPQQHSGFNDMQQMQQEVILRKMQEHQRHKELQQLHARQQNPVNHSHDLINGTPISYASNYPWATDLTSGNTSWRGPSSNGLLLSSEQGQAPHPMALVRQQVDQSLYGVPISSSRGSLNQYHHIATDNKPSMQQMPAYSNSFPGNQYAASPEQGFQGKHVFGHASGQGLDSGITMQSVQQLNALQRTAPVHEFQGTQELVAPSEIVQEKTAFESASSQNDVSLDPTEEKILFGSDDDNIWDAFGRGTNMVGGASNLLDGAGFMNGLPSVQSGSWSALMQSAVAETSSSDIGVQEEWTGLSFQNPELATGNYRRSAFKDDGKKVAALGDDSLQIAPGLNFGSAPGPLSEHANVSNKYPGVSGFQQIEQKFPHEHGERLQIGSSQKPIHQPSGSSRWLNRGPLPKPLAEGSQIYGNASHSVSPNGDGSPSIHENESSLQNSESNDGNRVMHEETSHSDGMWKVNSVPNSSVELDCVKFNLGSQQVNREGSSLNNAARMPNSSSTRAAEETSQFLPNGPHLNYWKQVESMARSKGSDDLGKSQHHLNKAPQFMESSSNFSDKEEVKMQQMENCNNDSRTQSSGKQKSSNNVGKKTFGPHKFQYHPMGNLDEDVEPSYGMRQSALSQAMSQQNSRGLKTQDQRHFGQSKLFPEVPKNSTEMGKGQSPDLQGDHKRFDEAPSQGILPGHIPNMSAQFNRSVGIFAPNKASQSSQNMLELLHKVDQSREHGSMMDCSSSEQNPSSEMPEAENSDGSGGPLQRSQSSASQGFGLQLAPPSQQRLPVSNHTSQSSTQAVNSLSSTQVANEIRDTVNSSMFKSDFPYSRSQIQSQHMAGARGQVSANQLINVSVDRHASHPKQSDDRYRILTGQSAEASAGIILHDKHSPSGDASRTADTNHLRAPHVSAGETPVSQPFNTTGVSPQGAFSKMFPNVWNNVPAQQHHLGAQARKSASNLSGSHQTNVVESASSAPESQEDPGSRNMGKDLNSQGFVRGERKTMKESPSQQVSHGNVELFQKMDEPQGKEPIVKHLSDASPANPASTRSDIEAFGHSLKPNNFIHENYSLLNQVRVMKNAEIDPSNRGLKRLKGPDNILGGQQVAPAAGQPNERNNMVGPSGDSKMLSFSGPKENLERNAASELGSVPSREMLAFCHNESQNYPSGNNTASVKVEHPQISPQMAPSWFNQYGTFKDGPRLPVFDAQKAASVKALEQPFTLGKSSIGLHTLNSMEQVNAAADTGQTGNIRQSSTPTSVAIEHFSSPITLPPHVGGQNVVSLRPKKRKIATSEISPWHKEISQGSRSLQTISVSEVDWSKAANRLKEKVGDGAEMTEDGPLMFRPKRRLILTTQLMQQLLLPPPSSVLSADASTDCESVSYFVSRLALGGACSLVSCSQNYFNAPPSGANILSDKCKTNERIDDQHLSKVMEDFMDRARKLENDLLRLDKRASVMDLRVECQDLEKFSVINRFALFHGRGQADGSEASHAAANAQRYVTALPMPKNLPDRVQCLSL